ncbi:acylphosphatase [Candidatus Gottesmanbacteria bacterium]|nr:acylphosphatase [Candidatus Gottesmanbacteria bacterium]
MVLKSIQRVHLIIFGDVQGVGFRSWIKRLAKDLDLLGWVKNRQDGAVEIVAEGAKDKLEELIKRCQRGPDVAWVKRVDILWQEASGEFVSFSVVY